MARQREGDDACSGVVLNGVSNSSHVFIVVTAHSAAAATISGERTAIATMPIVLLSGPAEDSTLPVPVILSSDDVFPLQITMTATVHVSYS